MCFGILSGILSDIADSTKRIDYSNPAPSFYEIRTNMNGLTDVQWEQYFRDQVNGKTAVNWSGWVEEVEQGSAGKYRVLVDMDPPSEILSIQDVYLELPAGQAGSLQKDQQIIFSGRISSVYNLLSSCQVSLDQAELIR